jgi:hypothetical protein
MRLAEGAYINNVARLDKTEDIEKESIEVEKEMENSPAPVSIMKEDASASVNGIEDISSNEETDE